MTGKGLDGPGIESRWRARFSPPVRTGPGAHPASCTKGTGSFLGVKSGRGVTLTPHPLLVPWSWKSRTIPLLPLWAVRLCFNRTQTGVVTGLLTGHNTLRRHLHIMGLCNAPMCRKCGTEEETSVHILCECEALASLRHAYLGSFFLDPEDIRELGMGAIWNFAKLMASIA